MPAATPPGIPEPTSAIPARVPRARRRRSTVLATAGMLLVCVVPVSEAAAAPKGAVSKAPDPSVSTMTFTAKERRDALAYWTPARIKAVGRSVDLGPTGPGPSRGGAPR